MTPLEIELLNLEHQEEHLRKIMQRLTVGSKEYTSYSYKLIECRRKLKEVKGKLRYDRF